MFFGVPTMYHRLAESRAGRRVGGAAALRRRVGPAPRRPVAAVRTRMRRIGARALRDVGDVADPVQSAWTGSVDPVRSGSRCPASRRWSPRPTTTASASSWSAARRCAGGTGTGPRRRAAMWVEGWFATGDLASVGDGGYFSIRGRRTELIITGGHNVYPAEVEAVLGRHPSVKEIAVIGVAVGGMGRVGHRVRRRRRRGARHRRPDGAGRRGAHVLQAAACVPRGRFAASQCHGKGRPARPPVAGPGRFARQFVAVA